MDMKVFGWTDGCEDDGSFSPTHLEVPKMGKLINIIVSRHPFIFAIFCDEKMD